MAPIPRSSLVRAIRKKLQFEEQRHTNTDHLVLALSLDGHKKCRAFLSHGSGYKDYSDALVSMVAKQLWVSAKVLHDIVRCTVSRDEYLEMIREPGASLAQVRKEPGEPSRRRR